VSRPSGMEAWRWWAGLGGLVVGASVWAWVGLTLFRRDWARRVLPYSRSPDVELCFGPLWLGLWRTARFAWRHPRTLKVGAIYGLHLLMGIEPLAALDEEALRRVLGR